MKCEISQKSGVLNLNISCDLFSYDQILIPESVTYESNLFYTIENGMKEEVLFKDDAEGNLSFTVGSLFFHKNKSTKFKFKGLK